MNYLCINGSPRKNMNSAKLLDAAAAELKKNGKEVKIYNLYDLNFKGCHSCFSCKKEHKKSYGECVVKDDLQNILQEVDKAEGLILASPIYFQDVSGEMRSFLERLLFRKFIYSNPPRTLVEEEKRVGFIYTMNIASAVFEKSPLKGHLEGLERYIRFIYKDINTYHSFSTNQLKDYTGIEYTYFDPKERLKNHKENFPKEIENVKNFIQKVLH
ncbi:flavodoxin family protein [Sulfurimonas sp. HSL-1716]|uniref:flavodoxin family protein n=1 Tax=Hydrocurvibacter sulfurireducens TaxID=3131937 RepID=UPI0031F96CBD